MNTQKHLRSLSKNKLTKTICITLIAFLIISKTSNAQTFTEQTDVIIQGIDKGCVDWGDYNNDGLYDFMIAGYDGNTDLGYAAIYINKGNNSFNEISGIIQPLEECYLDWGDYNNDNYIDILLSGGYDDHSSYTKYSEIYRNNTDGSFIHQQDINLTKAAAGVVKWGDFTNDGYIDIFQSGSSIYDWVTKIYTNNRNENFSESEGLDIPGVVYSKSSWGDFNNDGLLDFIYMGITTTELITKIYKNNGDNTFSPDNFSNIINVTAGSVEWCDYNNDGYLDFVIAGQREGNERLTKIYKNNGDETFSELTDVNLVGISWGNVTWGDYDNDGLSDILLTGTDSDTKLERHAKIFRNEGNDNFTLQSEIILIPVGDAWAAWGDYDNDQDLDIILTGFSVDYMNNISRIFRNNIPTTNNPPNPIENLQTNIINKEVYFSWDEATDNNQASEGLNYNIYVYEDGNPLPYIVSPHAFPQTDPLNGKRTVVQRGHIQGIRENGRVKYMLKDVFEQGKTYYWSVQAIDASFAGGPFPPEASFVYDTTANIQENVFDKISVNPNPSNGIFKINCVNRLCRSKISVKDISGKQVYSEELNYISDEIKLDLSYLNSGLYFLSVENKEYTKAFKIIIQK